MIKTSYRKYNRSIYKVVSGQLPNQFITLGKIGSCYGIQGWLRMFSYTEKEEDIFSYQPWLIYRVDHLQEVKLEKWRYCNQNFIFKLKHINNRNVASSLINCKVMVDSCKLPLLEEGCYYWKDLIGCQIITIDGYNLGMVVNIIATGSNDVLIVRSNTKDIFGIKERLITFLYNQIVKKVDLIAKTIKVDWDPTF